MHDLTTRLQDLSDPEGTTDTATVAGDIRRGRAVQHRRRRHVATSMAALGVTAVAVGGLVATSAPVTGDHPAATTSAGGSTQTAHHLGGIELASYTGPQVPGFVVRTVPAGFTLQRSDQGVLVLAPAGSSTSPDSATGFVGKVIVTLGDAGSSPSHDGTQVTVQGGPGWLSRVSQPIEGSLVARPGVTVAPTQFGAADLQFTEGTRDVLVQAADSLGLTDAQIVTLADGITVTPAAQAPVG